MNFRSSPAVEPDNPRRSLLQNSLYLELQVLLPVGWMVRPATETDNPATLPAVQVAASGKGAVC